MCAPASAQTRALKRPSPRRLRSPGARACHVLTISPPGSKKKWPLGRPLRGCWRLGNSVFGTDGDGLVTRPSGSHESVLVAPPLMIVCGLTRRTTVAVVLIAVSVSGVARVALTRRTSVIVIRVSIAPARLTRS